MARSQAHILAGAATSCAVVLWDRHSRQKQTELSHILLGLVVGVFFALLADILEPATNPYHRGFFHSLVFACFLGLILLKFFKKTDDDKADAALLLKAAGGAYASHLILDAGTPLGLPLI